MAFIDAYAFSKKARGQIQSNLVKICTEDSRKLQGDATQVSFSRDEVFYLIGSSGVSREWALRLFFRLKTIYTRFNLKFT